MTTEMTWVKGNDTETLNINGAAVAYIIRNPLSGWTAYRASGATIGQYATPYQAMSAAADTARTA